MNLEEILSDLITSKIQFVNIFDIVLNKKGEYFYIFSNRYPPNKRLPKWKNVKSDVMDNLHKVLTSSNMECCIIPSVYAFTIIYLQNTYIYKICIGYDDNKDEDIFDFNTYTSYVDLWKNMNNYDKDFFIKQLSIKNKKLYQHLIEIK